MQVVHLLEVVRVDEQDAQGLAGNGLARGLVRQAFHEAAAIGQASQRIGVRQLAQRAHHGIQPVEQEQQQGQDGQIAGPEDVLAPPVEPPHRFAALHHLIGEDGGIRPPAFRATIHSHDQGDHAELEGQPHRLDLEQQEADGQYAQQDEIGFLGEEAFEDGDDGVEQPNRQAHGQGRDGHLPLFQPAWPQAGCHAQVDAQRGHDDGLKQQQRASVHTHLKLGFVQRQPVAEDGEDEEGRDREDSQQHPAGWRQSDQEPL